MYLRGKRLDKKVFLCILFMVQVFLICVFLAFGSIYNEGASSDKEFDVQFVKSKQQGTEAINNTYINYGKIRVQPSGEFSEEFFHLSNDTEKTLCFRDGSSLDNHPSSKECTCQLEYHGKDCGQPEVLWRAFMTSKIPLNLSSPRQIPHKIFYMIKTTGISVDTLEIQIMELIHVVDLFIFCDEISSSSSSVAKDRSLRHHTNAGILKQFINKILIIDNHKCTPKMMYKKFRKTIADEDINGDDILLFSKFDEILNWRAIKYFKWYDNWPQPAKFRLKYTVYGYYWQHPESTVLGSGACQISVLEEIYKSDPDRMALTKKSGMIVGDLNHVGGWYCQYCYQPISIVHKLLDEGKDIFLDHKKVVDSIYIENLIANGLYVDGKLGLTRLHRFADKYYAPDYITNASWKYESILTNIYANYDDDYANE